MEVPAVRAISHYSSDMHILLVGEGDFSFAASLATAFQTAPRLYATSLDSREMLHTKYGKRKMDRRLARLSSKAVVVINEVDVRTMAQHPSLRCLSFDCIIYNFPHSGFDHGLYEFSTALIQKDRKLVKSFFKNARRMLKAGGEVHVAHHKCKPYSRWRVQEEASKSGLQLRACREFEAHLFVGYTPRRGAGDNANGTFRLRNPYTFIFFLSVSHPPPSFITPPHSDSRSTPTHIVSSSTPTRVIPPLPRITSPSSSKKPCRYIITTSLPLSHHPSTSSLAPSRSLNIITNPLPHSLPLSSPSISAPTLKKSSPLITIPCCPSTMQQPRTLNIRTTSPFAHSLVSSPPPIIEPPNHSTTIYSCPPSPSLTNIIPNHQHNESLMGSHEDTHKSLPSTSPPPPPPHNNTPTSKFLWLPLTLLVILGVSIPCLSTQIPWNKIKADGVTCRRKRS